MAAHDVILGTARWGVDCGDAASWLGGLPTGSADLVFTSPPYSDARTYGIGADRGSAAWVEWMRPVVREACRVSKCLVILNVSDRVSGGQYQNGPEWLHADLTRLDGLAAIRPYVWVKRHPRDESAPNGGQPGSGSRHFHRNAYEMIYGYAEQGKLPPPWSDNKAFGKPPRGRQGGPMTQRKKDGTRASVKPTGRMQKMGAAGLPDICNPGNVVTTSKRDRRATNVIKALVGGGVLGHPLAHAGEAPMPLAVAVRFVCWFAPPDGIICDPFAGSGTTAHAAIMNGRRFIGCDLRASQTELTTRRLATVTPDLFEGIP